MKQSKCVKYLAYRQCRLLEHTALTSHCDASLTTWCFCKAEHLTHAIWIRSNVLQTELKKTLAAGSSNRRSCGPPGSQRGVWRSTVTCDHNVCWTTWAIPPDTGITLCVSQILVPNSHPVPCIYFFLFFLLRCNCRNLAKLIGNGYWWRLSDT